MNEITETQQKAVTINDGFRNIDSQQVKDKQNKKSRISLIIISLIIILLLCGGIFAYYPITHLIQDFQCRELRNSRQTEDSNINYNCQTNTDCIRNEGMGCMHCINKNTNEKSLKLINETYARGVKEGCFPQLTCRQSTCQCINNKCQGVDITPNSTVDPTSDWKTYIDEQFLYSFKYPKDWKVVTEESLPPIANLIYSTVETAPPKWVIKFQLVPQDIRSDAMGIPYCMAHPEDKSRCETLTLSGNIIVGIDWGTSDENFANFLISHPNMRKVAGSLTPVNPKSKEILLQILSTFRFTEEANSVGNIINIKFVDGTDITDPISLLPLDIQTSIGSIKPLFTLDPQELKGIDKANIGLRYWFIITVKSGIDIQQTYAQLKKLEIIKYAERQSVPVPPPN